MAMQRVTVIWDKKAILSTRRTAELVLIMANLIG